MKEKPFAKLKSLSATRWSEAFSSSQRLIDCYQEVFHSLKQIAGFDDKNSRDKANMLLMRMEHSSTIFALITLNYVSRKVEPLVKVLQEKGQNCFQGLNKMQILYQILSNESRVEEEFRTAHRKCIEISQSIGVVFRANRSNIIAQTPIDYWFQKIFKPTIGTLCQSLKER